MKRVIIVRHAKTIHHGYDQDFDRTLTDRGKEDAERICHELLNIQLVPDLIISSPAVRTTQTTRIFADLFGYPAGNIRYEKKLYSGMQTTTFIQMLQELDDLHTTVMVVGHNPTVYYFIDCLLPEFSLDVPTCSTIVLEFDIDEWSKLESHSGKMTHRWIPDLL
ncbi:MAG: histidine phosphatase family protein [Bacteroidetes bacterium]|nr:histidine phosphatase family protein [Bacteroidota bacterium]MCL6101621.1 histidine phosphatase family protein [Bacteroidota bacterium]MCL6103768.1 histidine phosphatase family protein [Bacteroidota bacterium]